MERVFTRRRPCLPGLREWCISILHTQAGQWPRIVMFQVFRHEYGYIYCLARLNTSIHLTLQNGWHNLLSNKTNEWTIPYIQTNIIQITRKPQDSRHNLRHTSAVLARRVWIITPEQEVKLFEYVVSIRHHCRDLRKPSSDQAEYSLRSTPSSTLDKMYDIDISDPGAAAAHYKVNEGSFQSILPRRQAGRQVGR